MNLPTIGVAGVSIPGAVDCISKINQLSSRYFPDFAHPSILLDQPNFSPMKRALQREEWDVVLHYLLESVERLAKAGADFVIIPANTVHKVISELQQKSSIPILNMLQLVSEECKRKNWKKVGVMGSCWTMSGHLYRDVLSANGIEEFIPSQENQEWIQHAIMSELIPTGKVTAKTLSALGQVVEALKSDGCDGIALACTELPLVLNATNCPIPIIDTTAVLAEAALITCSKNY